MADVVAEVDLLVQDGSLDLAQTAVPGGAAVKEKKELRLSGDVDDRFLDGPACRRLPVCGPPFRPWPCTRSSAPPASCRSAPSPPARS